MKKFVQHRRKPKNAGIILIIAAAVIAAVIIAMIIGNLLGRKAAEAASGTEQISTAPEAVIPVLTAVERLTAKTVCATALADASPDAVAALADGVDVCFSLFEKTGKPAFSSLAERALGYGEDDKRLDAKALTAALKAKNIHISAYAGLDFEAPEYTGLLREYALAVINEFCSAGADDLLLGLSGDIKADSELINEITEEIRREHHELPIGIVIGSAAVTGDNASALISKLAESFDFIAIDVTGLLAETDGMAERLDEFLMSATLYFSRYNTRVFYPCTNDGDAAVNGVFDKNALYNRQEYIN